MSSNADEIKEILDDFNDGTVDNLLEDNTLVFEENDEETLRKAREERDKEMIERAITAKKAADEIVSSAKNLYSKNSNDIDYVQFKAKADADSLGKIIYQVELTEDVIKAVANSILVGFINPNLVKCFTDLQKTEVELLKTKNMYLTSIEESFKQITSDVEMTAAVEVETAEDADAISAKTRSSRDLMKLIDAAASKVKAEMQNGEVAEEPKEPKLF